MSDETSMEACTNREIPTGINPNGELYMRVRSLVKRLADAEDDAAVLNESLRLSEDHAARMIEECSQANRQRFIVKRQHQALTEDYRRLRKERDELLTKIKELTDRI